MEIKAGATITPDYFKGLTAFARGMNPPPPQAALVYGGADRQRRTGVTVWRATDVEQMLDESA